MSNLRKKPEKSRNTPGAPWIVGAAFLAIITGILIVWIVRQHAIPSVSVVSPVSYSNGSESYQPGTSRKYVIIEIEVKNPTTRAFNFAPVVQTYLTDDKGNRYDMAPAELSNPLAAGVILPGETKRGQLSYNVPVDVTKFVFHFVTDDSYNISYTQSL